MRSPMVRINWYFLLGAILAFFFGWPLVQANTQPSARNDLQIEYARARVALTEITLQQAQGMNSRVRGAVSANVVNEYRRDVDVARRHLDSLRAGDDSDQFPLWLRRAEANRQSAEARWKSAKAVHARVRGAFDSLEVRRLELQANLDRLLVEQGRAVADGPRNNQVAWQLEVLASETQRLKDEVQRAQPPGGYYPYYSY